MKLPPHIAYGLHHHRIIRRLVTTLKATRRELAQLEDQLADAHDQADRAAEAHEEGGKG